MTKMTNMSKNRKKTIPSDSDTISYDERNGSYDYNSRKRMNSLPIALPKLS
jgi:hypothetical protein